VVVTCCRNLRGGHAWQKSNLLRIFTDEYWQRPSARKEGDKDYIGVYAAVGFATTWWEFLENDLAELFCSFCGSRRPAIRRGYGAIFGNSGRRGALLAAAIPHFGEYWNDKLVKSATTRLLHAVGEASKRRDEIVHGAVSGFNR